MTDSGSIDGIGFFDKMNPVWAVQSMFVETDFESRSHEEMIEMVKASDPGTTRRLGQKLIDAATDMDAIATELETRGQRVQWEGEGADSFTKWNTDMASSTRRLATFSRTSGQALQGAADTLQEVKRDMPQYPESARLTLNDYLMQNPGGMAKLDQAASSKGSSSPGGPSAKEAADAKQQLENGHGEAVRQMRKLSTSYALSNTTINSSERPTFPPMPGELMPQNLESIDGARHVGASPRPTSVPPRPIGGVTGAGSAEGSVTNGSRPASDRLMSVGNAEMTLDGVANLPPAPAAPVQQQPGPHVSSDPTGPVVGPAGPEASRQLSQGRVGPGGQGPLDKSGPRSPSVGKGQAGPPAARGGVRAPADQSPGIHGGRPVPGGAGQPSHGLPRSSAIGADPVQNQHGRGPVAGRPMTGGFGGGGSGGPSSGVVGGRPIATTPGGRVGSSPSTPGVTGGRPFTPGGSGLLRAGAQSTRHGAMGRFASSASPGEEPGSQGERPDYPVEGEETWRPRNDSDAAPPGVD